MNKKIEELCVEYLPDRLFAFLYCNFYNRNTSISKSEKGWLIKRWGLELYAPNTKYLFPSVSEFEKKFERYFKIEPDDTAVDIGSCYGDTAIPMIMKVGQTGKVIAVEASPINAEFLRLNLTQYPNTEVIEKAVSHQQGEISFWLCTAPTGGSIEHAYGRNSEVKVQADTINNIFADVHIDFMKIDVQGTEVEAIQGGDKVLGRIPKLIVETHYRTSPARTYPRVLELMQQFGHEIHFEPENGIVYAWKNVG